VHPERASLGRLSVRFAGGESADGFSGFVQLRPLLGRGRLAVPGRRTPKMASGLTVPNPARTRHRRSKPPLPRVSRGSGAQHD